MRMAQVETSISPEGIGRGEQPGLFWRVYERANVLGSYAQSSLDGSC